MTKNFGQNFPTFYFLILITSHTAPDLNVKILQKLCVFPEGYVVDGWHVNNISTSSGNLLSVTLAEPRYLEKFDYGGRKMFWKASGIQERKIIIFIFLIKLLKDIHMILKF